LNPPYGFATIKMFLTNPLSGTSPKEQTCRETGAQSHGSVDTDRQTAGGFFGSFIFYPTTMLWRRKGGAYFKIDNTHDLTIGSLMCFVNSHMRRKLFLRWANPSKEIEMKKTVLALVLTLALTLTLVGSVGAITNGVPDGQGHPYVGLLVFDSAPGTPGWRCSGALITPTVVLTAGHCTDGAVAARIWMDEDVTYDNVPFPLYPYGGPGSGAVEGTAYTNPEYRSENNPYGGGNGLPAFSYRDTGIVVLDEPIFMDEYAELPEAGLVDTLKNKTAVDFVGYGVQFEAQIPGNILPQPPPYYRWTGPRIRMYAPSELVSGKFVHSAEYLRLASNPGGGSGGTCFGDSGGPDLLGGTNVVLGVNSYVTNVNCSGVGYSARVDVPEVLEWIQTFMP
jgi:hypothetical protein